MKFHPVQPYLLASGCLGGSVRLWNLDCLAKIGDAKSEGTAEISSVCVWKHSGAIASLAFHHLHPILVVAWTQEVVFYDWVSGRMLSVWRFVSNHSRVRWVKFAPDGTVLYTATANPTSTESTHVHKSPCQTVNNSPTKVEPIKASVKKPLDCSNTSEAVQNTCNGLVPRDALLSYLAKCTDSWFQNLNICPVCSVRLCRWAGTLGPKFPAVTTDIHLGMSVAQQAAAVAATTTSANMLPSHVQELLNLRNPNRRSEISERLHRDANPAAVAIIEDMPVHEFLLSRGNYCQFPNVAIQNGGICCGGHACDLVITHRDLMRHSLCRPCLSSFWCWASKHVAWWRWSFPTSSDQPLSPVIRDINRTCGPQPISDAKQKSNIVEKSSGVCSVGICIQCQAKMSSQLQSSSSSSVSSHGISSLTPVSSVDTVSSHSEKSSKSHHFIPLAALDLLRSRLSNAHEVTPITYVATDLISDYVFSQYIKKLLTVDHYSGISLPRNLWNPVTTTYNDEVNNTTVCVSSSKRRKLDHPLQNQSVLNHVNNHSSLNSLPECQALDIYSNTNSGILECSPSTSTTCELQLPQEASDLGTYMRDNPDNDWNYPRPAAVHCSSKLSSWVPSLIFPYVQGGASLLKSPRHVNSSSSQLVLGNPVSQCSRTSKSPENETQLTDVCNADYDEAYDRSSMTACCRCGHIVLRTFPVDPHSNLSAAVCEKLVCAENQSNDSANQSGPSDSNDSSSSSRSLYQSDPSSSHPHSSISTRLTTHCRQSQSGAGKSNSPVHLMEHNGNNSVLNVVNRGITEVITGLFIDMGEYGSASNLQDVTYRICRWELSLCSSAHSIHRECTVSDESREDLDENDGTKTSCLPMPTNVAVSYNNNSLVVPHARLFNDSSICISPDGRLLAAFVIPRETSYSTLQSSSNILKTILAVYRLQPEHNRGQCLFSRHFAALSPVCLDFSPMGDYLAVGFATTRIPSESYSSVRQASVNRDLISYGDSTSLESSNSQESNIKYSDQRQSSVASVFHLERVKNPKNQRVSRCLRDIQNIKHPALLEPISSRYIENSETSVDKLDRWHRLLLSAPSGLSLNTIVWNTNGSILYGTTKGLIVISRGNSSSSISVLPLECTKSHFQSADECEVSYRRKYFINRTQHIPDSHNNLPISQRHIAI
ncbi:unnamed protein product [Trichobilharzia szidati]|nr:unnamed protein product [Trichobilharzia szidati]